MSSKQQGTHLACRECQRKKIKCSRTFPCVQCMRAGISCKASTRKPRAKAGKTGDAELRERIFKLEKLVETFSGEDVKDVSRHPSNATSFGNENSTSPPLDCNNAASPVSPSEATELETSKYVASTFWSSLTAEVKALADVFAENEGNDEETPPDDSPSSAQNLTDAPQAVNVDFELIFCPPGVLYVMPGATLEPDSVFASQLFSAYLTHVEPICTFALGIYCLRNAIFLNLLLSRWQSRKMIILTLLRSQNISCPLSTSYGTRGPTISRKAMQRTMQQSCQSSHLLRWYERIF